MKLNHLQRLLTTAGAVLMITALAVPAQVHAQKLESWSKKIDNVNQRFKVLSDFYDEAVLDRETQLVWQRTLPPLTDSTVLQIAAVQSCSQRDIGGRRGWRIPSIHELSSLLVPTGELTAALPDGHPFENVTDGFYWSGTLVNSPQHEVSNFWVQNFSTGQVQRRDQSGSGFIWCVRGGGPISGM